VHLGAVEIAVERAGVAAGQLAVVQVQRQLHVAHQCRLHQLLHQRRRQVGRSQRRAVRRVHPRAVGADHADRQLDAVQQELHVAVVAAGSDDQPAAGGMGALQGGDAARGEAGFGIQQGAVKIGGNGAEHGSLQKWQHGNNRHDCAPSRTNTQTIVHKSA